MKSITQLAKIARRIPRIIRRSQQAIAKPSCSAKEQLFHEGRIRAAGQAKGLLKADLLRRNVGGPSVRSTECSRYEINQPTPQFWETLKTPDRALPEVETKFVSRDERVYGRLETGQIVRLEPARNYRGKSARRAFLKTRREPLPAAPVSKTAKFLAGATCSAT